MASFHLVNEMMAGIDHVSEVVYHCVNEIMGCREEVKMRRDILGITDIIFNFTHRDNKVSMASGSMCEGFHMNGSDYDFMFWSPKLHVICDLTQLHLYNSIKGVIVLMEDKYTRPGFVLLRLLNRYFCACAYSYLLPFHSGYYLSSLLHRHATFYHGNLQNARIHGPCTSGFANECEYDLADCLKSKHWPPQAFSWIERCIRQRWPSPSVLRNIVKGGCHFMAIGAKNSPSELAEWRLSFSQAENKLVHSMNHYQFLVYGLLKVFLKEVLNKNISEDRKLLCSYFMKTTVFWTIQENIIFQWNVDTFLFCFWNCYKLLIKWVYHEYCPNFFVPQNNMFFPKITGIPQKHLFCQMFDLYSEGIQCLLRCSSIHDKLSARLHPHLRIFNVLHFSEFDYDLSLYNKIVNTVVIKCTQRFIYRRPIQVHVEILNFLFNTLRRNLSQSQRVFVYRSAVQMFQHLGFLLQTNNARETNKKNHRPKKQGLRIMKAISKLGNVTDTLYLALYYYNDGKYRNALCLLQKAQSTLYRPYIMYRVCSTYHYIHALGGQPMSTKVKEAMLFNIYIPVFTMFPELRLELTIAERTNKPHLRASPFLVLHFLSFLCYYHLGNAQKQQALYDLHRLVHYDNDRYTQCKYHKNIGWQMLGICHQLSNHKREALECYREAYTCPSDNTIPQAALCRMKTL